MFVRTLLSCARSVAVALIGAAAALWLNLPLPWFTGPLIAVAIVNMAGGRLADLPRSRDGGQWIIGTVLGLYFTPAIIGELVRLAPWIVLTLAVMIVLGAAAARLLQRATGVSGTTAFFAMAIGGAAEMAAQAERNGGRVDRVAAAHSLRIMMVALIVPFAFQWSGAQGSDPYQPAQAAFSAVGLATLAAVTGGGAIALERLRVPNHWMIGPLAVTAALTAGGYAFTSLPAPLVWAGQLLIGIALGTRFEPEFFRAAPRYLAVVAMITLVLLAVGALYAWAMARLSGLATPTAILAATPGGIGEMAITARELALGAPIVAAFHTARLAVLVLVVGPMHRWLRPWLDRAPGA